MYMKIKNRLSPEESSRLAELEPIVERGLLQFKEVGDALAEISDKRLYRGTHSTFKEYVEDKYKMSAQHAYRMIESAEVIKSLPSPMGDKINERQARELAKVEPSKRSEVVETVAKAGPVTAKAIKAEVKKREPQPEQIKPAKVNAVKTVPVEQTFVEREQERLEKPEKTEAEKLIDGLQYVIGLIREYQTPKPGDDWPFIDWSEAKNILISTASKLKNLS